MSSKNPNSKRSPLLEMMDEMEKDTQRKKDAQLAVIESSKPKWKSFDFYMEEFIKYVLGFVLGLITSYIIHKLNQ